MRLPKLGLIYNLLQHEFCRVIPPLLEWITKRPQSNGIVERLH